MKRIFLSMIILAGLHIGVAHAQSAEQITQNHLYAGTLANGENALGQRIASNRADAEAHLGLALIRTARAVERLANSMYRHGLQAPRNTPIPIVRMPVPPNPNPQPLTYAQMRAIYQTFLDDLTVIQKGLETRPAGSAKVRIDLHQIRLDINGDGKADDAEKLGLILAGIRMTPAGATAASFPVAFDESDAIWLRGYTHLLSSFLEFALAYDWRETFDATAHLFFTGARTAGITVPQARANPFGSGSMEIADAIAFIHLARWPLAEPARMGHALSHLKAVVRLSRENWNSILAETDDEHEWVPSPNQKNAAITAMTVTQERAETWLAALGEFEAILDGKLLMPHWRYEQGFDFSSVFTQPRQFDLVLWMTGHAAIPYLRDGKAI
ncbi:MAG: hypothetical protein ACRCTD_03015, partial [Beijerinckiaceae bacterium]